MDGDDGGDDDVDAEEAQVVAPAVLDAVVDVAAEAEIVVVILVQETWIWTEAEVVLLSNSTVQIEDYSDY